MKVFPYFTWIVKMLLTIDNKFCMCIVIIRKVTKKAVQNNIIKTRWNLKKKKQKQRDSKSHSAFGKQEAV